MAISRVVVYYRTFFRFFKQHEQPDTKSAFWIELEGKPADGNGLKQHEQTDTKSTFARTASAGSAASGSDRQKTKSAASAEVYYLQNGSESAAPLPRTIATSFFILFTLSGCVTLFVLCVRTIRVKVLHVDTTSCHAVRKDIA